MAKTLVKDLPPEKRAERALRQKLAKAYRYYGEYAPIEEVEYQGEEEGYHTFIVQFERYLHPCFFEVKLYAKSAKVYRA